MRRRTFLIILFLGFLAAGSFAGSFATAATTATATAACGGKQGLSQQLECWAAMARGPDGPGGDPVLVSLQGQVPLGDGAPASSLQNLQSAFKEGPLVVSVPRGRTTGPGGTLMLILTDKRLVAPDSVISALDVKTVNRLKEASACGATPPTICDLVAGRPRQGRELIAGGHAKDIVQYAETAGTPRNGAQVTEPTGSGAGGKGGEEEVDTGGGFRWSLFILVGGIALMAIAIFVVRRALVLRLAGDSPADRRAGTHPAAKPPPRPPTAAPRTRVQHRSHPAPAPTGPRSTATLRTELHPQGYVEVDHCLFRAAWADPDVPPPALGELVDVVKGTGEDSDILLAYPGGGR